MQRAKQLSGDLAFPDPPFPAVRREHDVHVPDQRPHDVVGGEVARGQAVHGATMLPGDGRPNNEVDHRLGDHPDHVEVLRYPVLELLGDGEANGRQVEGNQRTRAADFGGSRGGSSLVGAHSTGPWANTRSMTSSIGGSSMVRSIT